MVCRIFLEDTGTVLLSEDGEEMSEGMCKLVCFDTNKYVADIKLSHVKNISEQAGKTKNITRIVLFGSSIEKRCTEQSDIDIAVFGKAAKSKYIDSKEFREFKSGLFKFDWNQDYDVLYFKEKADYSDRIMNDIGKGVEIYRRTAE